MLIWLGPKLGMSMGMANGWKYLATCFGLSRHSSSRATGVPALVSVAPSVRTTRR
jgi:hypothetical protein